MRLLLAGFEVFLAWPWLTTLKALSFGMGLADVHRDTLSSECSGLVRVDSSRCGGHRSRWKRSSNEGSLVGGLDSASLSMGNILEDCACLY